MNNTGNLNLDVVNEALSMLSEASSWNKQSEFGETCDKANTKHTLGCAMELSQVKVKHTKKSWSKEMMTVRGVIYMNFFWRAGLHPFTYFNRHKKTTHADILFVLNKAKAKLEK